MSPTTTVTAWGLTILTFSTISDFSEALRESSFSTFVFSGFCTWNFSARGVKTSTGTSTSFTDVSEKINFNTALLLPTCEVSALVLISTLIFSVRFVIPSFNLSIFNSSFLLSSISSTFGVKDSDKGAKTSTGISTILEEPPLKVTLTFPM